MKIDFEMYKHGVDLLTYLLDLLPEDCTRLEAIGIVEESIRVLKAAVLDEA